MHKAIRFVACYVFTTAFFTGCKIENHSPKEVAQRFASSKEECWASPEFIEQENVYAPVDSEVVRIPTFSADSVGCPTQDAILEFKSKNPNRFFVRAEKVGFVEKNRPVFGVIVYSREYTKSVPVSDGELRDKSAP